MNERLIQDFIDRAAQAPKGGMAQALIAIVAEHCAMIGDSINDTQETEASKIIRAAFIPEAPCTTKQ